MATFLYLDFQMAIQYWYFVIKLIVDNVNLISYFFDMEIMILIAPNQTIIILCHADDTLLHENTKVIQLSAKYFYFVHYILDVRPSYHQSIASV